MVIIIKIFIKIIKKIIFSFLLLFSLNISVSKLGMIIPINWFNLSITTILGVPGLIGLIVMKLFVF